MTTVTLITTMATELTVADSLMPMISSIEMSTTMNTAGRLMMP